MARKKRGQDVTAEDEPIQEITTQTPVVVPETFRLFRLTPVADDLTRPHRQSAVVAANSDEEARAFAAAADPFGRPWTNATEYACDVFEDSTPHVVGDVVFKSIAAPAPGKKPRGNKPMG